MTRFRKLVIASVVVLALGGLVTGVAIATTGGDDGGGEEPSLTGSSLEKASAAALAHTGGGTVVDTETGDDGATYGVEIRLADGSQVEVSLDATFDVIGQEADDDGPSEQAESTDH